MKQYDEQPEESFINIKIKTMNHTTYEIIINPLKNIRSFQHQIEQVCIFPILRKRKCRQIRKDYSIGGLYSTLTSPWLIIVSKKAMSYNL